MVLKKKKTNQKTQASTLSNKRISLTDGLQKKKKKLSQALRFVLTEAQKGAIAISICAE